jgi:hypothetical protein
MVEAGGKHYHLFTPHLSKTIHIWIQRCSDNARDITLLR